MNTTPKVLKDTHKTYDNIARLRCLYPELDIISVNIHFEDQPEVLLYSDTLDHISKYLTDCYYEKSANADNFYYHYGWYNGMLLKAMSSIPAETYELRPATTEEEG